MRVWVEVRIRFTSPHPKDFPLPLLQLMRERTNICNQVHLPAQSGDDAVLESMGRGYTVDTYLQVVEQIRSTLGPETCITSDFICGFCGETEEAHRRSLDLVRRVGYDFVYGFPYSMRAKTRAHRRLRDDVPDEVKKRRTDELLTAFRESAAVLHQRLVGSTQLVLVTGPAKREPESFLQGRTDGGTKCIIPNSLPSCGSAIPRGGHVAVAVERANSQTLHGTPLRRLRSLKEGQALESQRLQQRPVGEDTQRAAL